MKRYWLALFPILAILAIAGLWGCAEDGLSMGACGNGVVDPQEQCDDGNSSAGDGCSDLCAVESDDLVLPTLHSIQQRIFTPTCTPCHWSQGIGQWMPLDSEDASYESLVLTDYSFLCSGRRVEPGDPDNSCLVLKIEGSIYAGGVQMPPRPAPPLSPEQIAAIRQWILNGAPR